MLLPPQPSLLLLLHLPSPTIMLPQLPMLDMLVTHMLTLAPMSVANVKLKLMLIQLTSTTDIPVTLDGDMVDTDMLDLLDTMVDMLDTHTLMPHTHTLMPHMPMLHLTQPTPTPSTPPV